MTNFRINPDRPFNNIVTNISSGFNSYVDTDPQSINTLATLNYGNKILHDKDKLSGSAREFAYPTVRPHISSSLQNKGLIEIPNRSISAYSPTLNQSRNVRIALVPDAIRQNKFDFSSNAFDFGYPTVKNYGWCGEKLSTVWSNSGGRVGAFAFYSKGADTTGMNLGINHQQPPLQYPYNTRSSFVVGNNNTPNCFCNVINLSGTYVFDWTLEYGLRLKSSSNTFVDTGDITLQSGPDYFDIKLYSNVNTSYIWIRFRPPVRWRYYYNDWTFNEDFSILENSTTEFVRVVNCCGDDAEAPPIPSPGSSLTPTFGSATATTTGFTVQITNYNSAYTWGGTVTSSGSVAISGSGLVTVANVAAGISSTATITTSRAGHASGSATVTATSLAAALTPTFGATTATANGFTVQISNYNAAYTWAGTVTSSGTVVVSGSGLVTVTGVAPGTSSTATITTTRTGYSSGSATVTATSVVGAALTPTFGSTTATATGFTVQISNYNAAYTWAGTATSSGTVVVSGSGLVTVTGVAPATSSTATITTTRTGYSGGTASVTATSLLTYTFTTSSGQITITGYTGAGGAISIPSTIGGLPVVAIGNSAFYSNSIITSVSIPSSVTSIGNYAFQGCTGLTSVSIPSSVTSIGIQAFSDCIGLTAITVDTNNLSYSSTAGVLYNKSQTTLIQCPGSLTSVSIPSSVTTIGFAAFYKCTNLTSVSIPSSVTNIQNYAFDACSGLTSVTLPSGVATIFGYNAFRGCSGLTSVSIPIGITTIGFLVFNGCTGLTSVTISNSVTYISSDAFNGCTGLTTVTIANGQLSGITSPTANPPGVAFFGRTVATQLPV